MSYLWQRFLEAAFGTLYTFQHQAGLRHVVRAKSPDAARRKMRSFLVSQCGGDWAMTYNAAAVERELARCRIVVPESEVQS